VRGREKRVLAKCLVGIAIERMN